MKNAIPFLALLFFCLSNLSFSQSINGAKTYPIYKKGAQLVQKFDEEGFEVVRIEYDLVFSSKSTMRNLSKDWEYMIIGFGDDGVKDLDIKVYEYDDLLEKWTLIKKNASTDAVSAVTIKPKQSALYKIEIIVYEYHEGYNAAKYGLMVVDE